MIFINELKYISLIHIVSNSRARKRAFAFTSTSGVVRVRVANCVFPSPLSAAWGRARSTSGSASANEIAKGIGMRAAARSAAAVAVARLRPRFKRRRRVAESPAVLGVAPPTVSFLRSVRTRFYAFIGTVCSFRFRTRPPKFGLPAYRMPSGRTRHEVVSRTITYCVFLSF